MTRADCHKDLLPNERQSENGLQVWLLPHPLGEAPATGEPPPPATEAMAEEPHALHSGAQQAEAVVRKGNKPITSI